LYLKFHLRKSAKSVVHYLFLSVVFVPSVVNLSPEMNMNAPLETRAKLAAEQLDTQVREIINWHFSPETGCPFWLEWAKTNNIDPRKEVHNFADLKKLAHF